MRLDAGNALQATRLSHGSEGKKVQNDSIKQARRFTKIALNKPGSQSNGHILQVQSVQQLIRLVGQHFVDIVRPLIVFAHANVRLVVLDLVQNIRVLRRIFWQKNPVQSARFVAVQPKIAGL